MSTQLEQQGIELTEGYDPSQLDPAPDLVVVGNAMSRGNPCVEYVLDRNLPYISGPQWLLEHVLQDRWVLAVAGTHGKTTTASMLAWVLEYAKLEPGFLIGGVPGNFPVSARLGSAPSSSSRRTSMTALSSTSAQVRPLPPTHPGDEQPGVRPRGYLPGSGRHPASVPPPDAHRAEQR